MIVKIKNASIIQFNSSNYWIVYNKCNDILLCHHYVSPLYYLQESNPVTPYTRIHLTLLGKINNDILDNYDFQFLCLICVLKSILKHLYLIRITIFLESWFFNPFLYNNTSTSIESKLPTLIFWWYPLFCPKFSDSFLKYKFWAFKMCVYTCSYKKHREFR